MARLSNTADTGLQVQGLASAPTEVAEAAPDTPDIGQAGQGSTTPTNPLAGVIGFKDYEAARTKAMGEPAGPAEPGFSPGGSGQANDLVSIAKQFIGAKYVWGASDPARGFDCSGFIQYIYKRIGIDLPRVSYQQMGAGRRVDPKDLQVGDLIGWDYSDRNPGADHIGMYIGNGQFIHTNDPSKPLRIEALSSKPQNYYATRIL